MSRKEDGYAAAAAMLAAAAFALIAAQVARTSRSEVQSAGAEAATSRLKADIDAGLAIALSNMKPGEDLTRWRPQDGPYASNFGGAALSITIEDERGKIPLNTIDRSQIEAMFRAVGASPERVASLRDAFLDWRDPQRADRTRPADPTRLGGFASIYELRELDDLEPRIFDRLLPVVTVANAGGSFAANAASPLALAVMQGADAGSVQGLERRRELSGERTALDTSTAATSALGYYTVRVRAQDAFGDVAACAYLVEITGSKLRPVIVRGAAPSPTSASTSLS